MADGFPIMQIIGLELQPCKLAHSSSTEVSLTLLQDFWDMGHKTFNSTPETFPAKFLSGDIFDSSFLAPAKTANEVIEGEPSTLSILSSLSPLRGRLSAIYAYSIFHLFTEEQQEELAHRLGSLLSPEPGSIIFGAHTGLPEPGIRTERIPSGVAIAHFCHSPDSWVALWDKVFGKGKVEVKAHLEETSVQKGFATPPGQYKAYWYLVWTVTRIEIR